MAKKKAKKEVEKDIYPLTYLGEGNVSGEYLFKEIAGSVSATNLEEAKVKALDLFNRGYRR